MPSGYVLRASQGTTASSCFDFDVLDHIMATSGAPPSRDSSTNPCTGRRQKPLPGSEAALRRLVEGIETGNPPYEEMSSQLEQLVRMQLPLLQPLAEYLGAFRSIEFRGVQGGGWDQYDVHCERGTSRWRILLSGDDRIASANLDWDRPNSAVGSLVLSRKSAFRSPVATS
jgi:hypothetical protein